MNSKSGKQKDSIFLGKEPRAVDGMHKSSLAFHSLASEPHSGTHIKNASYKGRDFFLADPTLIVYLCAQTLEDFHGLRYPRNCALSSSDLWEDGTKDARSQFYRLIEDRLDEHITSVSNVNSMCLP